MLSKYWQFLLTFDAGFYVYEFHGILILIILLSVRQYQSSCIHFLSVFLDRNITLYIPSKNHIFWTDSDGVKSWYSNCNVICLCRLWWRIERGSLMCQCFGKVFWWIIHVSMAGQKKTTIYTQPVRVFIVRIGECVCLLSIALQLLDETIFHWFCWGSQSICMLWNVNNQMVFEHVILLPLVICHE